MTQKVPTDAIKQLLAAETKYVAGLLRLLKQENEQLKSHDASALEALVEQKQSLLNQLAESAKIRQALLQEQGLSFTEPNWQRYLKALKQPKLEQTWQSLVPLIKQCREINQINGKLINRAKQNVSQLANILKGKPLNHQQLYNAKGEADTHNGFARHIEA